MNEITLAPSRLPITPAIAREYDLTPGGWRVLVESIFPSAQTIEAVLMALAYCKQRNLDIYKRPVHIVPMWDNRKRKYVETVWEGLASVRTTAARTGAYAGIDAVEYGPTIKHTFRGERDVWERSNKTGTEPFEKTIEYPEWASVVVYRMVGGERHPFHAKIFWRETYGTVGKSEVPNDMWARRPFGQFDKCVEVAGLRKAFPEELGSVYIADEMEGRTIEIEHDQVEVRPTPPKPPKPPAKNDIPVKTERVETTPPKGPDQPPKPPKPVPQSEPVPQEEQSESEPETFAEALTPGELLSELDDALGTAKTGEEIETIYDDYDLEARLEQVPQGEEFIGVAIGIKRRHLKRVANG